MAMNPDVSDSDKKILRENGLPGKAEALAVRYTKVAKAIGMTAPPQPNNCHMPFERKLVNVPWLGERRLSKMIAVRNMRAIPTIMDFCFPFRLTLNRGRLLREALERVVFRRLVLFRRLVVRFLLLLFRVIAQMFLARRL